MFSVDAALSILKKYGYNSNAFHPFLYCKGNAVGLIYSYIDECYGILERSVIFKNINDLDLFLKKLQWYKINGKVNGVHIELSNYEIVNPQIIFIRNNHVMSDYEIFNIKNFDKREEKYKSLSHNKRLIAEAQDLMDVYYIKKEKLNKAVNNFYKKENELKRYYNNLQLLINQYNGKEFSTEFKENYDTYEYKDENENKIDVQLAKFRNSDVDNSDAQDIIKMVWNLNKNLELNKDYLEALKSDDGLEEEMRLVITKIDFMKELLKKKKKIFRKVIDLKKAFNNIDNSSTFKNIYGNDFDKKVVSFVNNKYDAFEKINEFKLCEYLNDFVGKSEYDIEKNIKKCSSIEVLDNIQYCVDLEKIKASLTREFDKNLSEDEQAALILYTSIYKDIFDMIMSIDNYNEIKINDLISLLNITVGFNQVIDNSFNFIKKIVMQDCNSEIRSGIFKNVNFKSKEAFIDSIRNNINYLSNVNNKIKCNYNLRLYFDIKNIDDLGKDRFIFTSCSISNFVYKNNKSRVIMANIYKGLNVLFSPKYLKLPIPNAYNQKMELIDEVNPQIILDSKDILIHKGDNVTILSKFNENIVTEKDYKYVDAFNLDYKVNISKLLIEKRK